MENKPTLLYVNDNLKSRRLMASILGQCGFEVITAPGFLEAIELITSVSFDLVLLSYHMPQMTGAQLAQEVKGFVPGLPVVLLSGLSSPPPGELLYVDAHLGHSSTVEDLTDVIRGLIQVERTALQSSPLLHHKAN